MSGADDWARDDAVRSPGMSSEVATALGAAFVASILTTVGSRWIAGFQARKQREQARLADERSLRDAKRERLRGDYVALTFAADAFLSASKQLAVLWAGDTPEARAERIQDQLEEATADLEWATIRLRLEEGTQSIVEAFQRVRGLWFTYQYQLPDADRRHDHSEVGETLRKMEAEVEGIVGTAKADLDELGKPI